MNRLTRALVTTAALLSVTGCHARYKKMAPALGSVRPTVAVPGGPSVELGDLSMPESAGAAGDVVEVAVAVGAAMEAGKTQGALLSALPPEDLAESLQLAVTSSPLEAALPHKIGPKGKHTMQVSVLDYGLDVSSGAPVFHTTVQVRILRERDGKRMYRATTSCSQPLSAMPGIPIGVVQQVQAFQSMGQVQSMPTEQLRQIALTGVEQCGQRVVERMVRHAT